MLLHLCLFPDIPLFLIFLTSGGREDLNILMEQGKRLKCRAGHFDKEGRKVKEDFLKKNKKSLNMVCKLFLGEPKIWMIFYYSIIFEYTPSLLFEI